MRPLEEEASASTAPLTTDAWLEPTSAAGRLSPRRRTVHAVAMVVATVLPVYGFVELPSDAATGGTPILDSPLSEATVLSRRILSEARALSVIQQVRDQVEVGRVARAVDIVYDCLDELLLAGSFYDAAITMRVIADSNLPLTIMLSALTISLPWRAKLGTARKDLARACRDMATKEGGTEKATAVLFGLA